MAGEPTLVCNGIRRAYRTDEDLVWALWDVEAVASDRQLTVLAGPSGSGKSTLLRVMAGIDRPDAGTITIGGTELGQLGHRKLRRFRSRHIGFLFQDPAANLLSYMTVRDHLRMAARIRRVEPSETLLSDLEIGGLAAELPVRLSAGQQQRAALAAALIGNPDVILADEPTAELDTESAHLAVTTLRRARDLGATLVVTSHDPEVIDAADHVIYLEHGAIR